jgi:hypothetical protein
MARSFIRYRRGNKAARFSASGFSSMPSRISAFSHERIFGRLSVSQDAREFQALVSHPLTGTDPRR